MTLTVTAPKPTCQSGLQDAVESPEDRRVTLRIEYCAPGNYRRSAEALCAAVSERFDVTCELVPSRGGVFEVRVDHRLIFSKRATRRLPARDEIFYHVRAAAAARKALSSG